MAKKLREIVEAKKPHPIHYLNALAEKRGFGDFGEIPEDAFDDEDKRQFERKYPEYKGHWPHLLNAVNMGVPAKEYDNDPRIVKAISKKNKLN